MGKAVQVHALSLAHCDNGSYISYPFKDYY
jgi:hypothetical protein